MTFADVANIRARKPGEEKNDAKPASSLKDRLSLALASASLLVSLSLAYLTWHPRDEVQVRLAGIEIENRGDPNHADEVVAWFAFSNTGNRTALITGAEWEVAIHGDTWLDYGAEAGPCTTDRGEFPLVLEKDKVKLVRFRGPLTGVLNFAGEDADTLRQKPRPPDRKLAEIDYAIKVAAIDSHGDEHGAKFPCCTVKVKDGHWVTFHPQSTKLPLFGQRYVNVSFRIDTTNEEGPQKLPAKAEETEPKKADPQQK